MYSPLEAFIGLRYVRAKRRNHFISFISLISMLGIALGVTTLITVISVMNGFEKELRARILGAIAHATIQPIEGSLSDWRKVIEEVERHPEVDGAAPYIEEGVWLQGRESSGAFIRGVEPAFERNVSEVADKMLYGSLEDLRAGEFGIILGIGLAGAGVGAWVSGMIGISAPSSRLTDFEAAIERGELLMMLDVPKGRVEEITDLVKKHHPEAQIEGTEPVIPAFP